MAAGRRLLARELEVLAEAQVSLAGVQNDLSMSTGQDLSVQAKIYLQSIVQPFAALIRLQLTGQASDAATIQAWMAHEFPALSAAGASFEEILEFGDPSGSKAWGEEEEIDDGVTMEAVGTIRAAIAIFCYPLTLTEYGNSKDDVLPWDISHNLRIKYPEVAAKLGINVGDGRLPVTVSRYQFEPDVEGEKLIETAIIPMSLDLAAGLAAAEDAGPFANRKYRYALEMFGENLVFDFISFKQLQVKTGISRFVPPSNFKVSVQILKPDMAAVTGSEEQEFDFDVVNGTSEFIQGLDTGAAWLGFRKDQVYRNIRRRDTNATLQEEGQ